ncbi:MAG: phosphotransferase family protein [Solirubrobacterales bacterium]
MAEPPDPAAVRELLGEALAEDPGVLELEDVPGGASRQTYLVVGEGGRWVLRRDPPGAESFSPLGAEVEVNRAAAAAGVPVPRIVAFEPAGGRLDSAGFLMDYLEGTSVAPRVLRRDELATARERVPGQLAQALARIHSLDPGDLPLLPAVDGDPALAACEFWEQALDDVGEPLPAVEAGLRWLRLNPPPPVAEPRLVHGDFRLGNFIVNGDGLVAVIDWELCHDGDPAEDIGWLCIRSWRFGNDDRPVAGLGALDEFLAAYEAAGGVRPEPERLRWWEALGNAKWAVICARQAADHLSGRRPSAELASLGRRICEPEWDLLELVG